jgi:hypothetical protein
LNTNKWIKIDDFTNAYDYDDSCFYGLIKELEAGNIRVKYLDKEDIESLGFNPGKLHPKNFVSRYGFTENSSLDWQYFNNGVMEISFYKSPQEIIAICNGKYYDEQETFFRGIIKNKSELKKILKMIGV